jgi:hypothetical protein
VKLIFSLETIEGQLPGCRLGTELFQYSFCGGPIGGTLPTHFNLPGVRQKLQHVPVRRLWGRHPTCALPFQAEGGQEVDNLGASHVHPLVGRSAEARLDVGRVLWLHAGPTERVVQLAEEALASEDLCGANVHGSQLVAGACAGAGST